MAWIVYTYSRCSVCKMNIYYIGTALVNKYLSIFLLYRVIFCNENIHYFVKCYHVAIILLRTSVGLLIAISIFDFHLTMCTFTKYERWKSDSVWYQHFYFTNIIFFPKSKNVILRHTVNYIYLHTAGPIEHFI